MATALSTTPRWRTALAGFGVVAATVGGVVAGPSIVAPDIAPQASADYEKVFNTATSVRAIGVRVYYAGRNWEHVAGPGQGIQVGGGERITSFTCPGTTRCTASVNGGIGRTFYGPTRVTVPEGSTVTVSVRYN